MTSMQIRFPHFAEVIAVCLFGMVYAHNYAIADAVIMPDPIRGFGEEYWGRILRITNNVIVFQVDCTGELLKFKWKGFRDPVVHFSRSCTPVEVVPWGNPPPDICDRFKRVFEFGNPDTDGYASDVIYDDNSGILSFDHGTADELRYSASS